MNGISHALVQARVVTGSLVIDGDAPVSLPALELVGGSLIVSRAGTPAQLDAASLAHIGGDLSADEIAALIARVHP